MKSECVTGCGEIMNNLHMLRCYIINLNVDGSIYYNQMFNGTLVEKLEGLKKWEESEKKYEEFETSVIQ